MAVLSVNMMTANMLLSVFLVSGVWADCQSSVSLFITAPKEMRALSGSCLHIPCNFSAKDKQGFETGQTFGVWIKSSKSLTNNKGKVIFNSSVSINPYNMSFTGNLSQRNCSTLFYSLLTNHSDKYYFRAESKSFKATADCDPLQITVKDSPPKPRIKISGDLKEKDSVTITCSAPTPCPHSPPQLTWNLQQHPYNMIKHNTDQTFTTKIQETITLSDQHDGYNITCSARYPVNGGEEKTAEETKTLSVSYAPKDTSVSVSPSGLVSAGSLVNLTCSSRAKPPVSRFTWFKKSKDGVMNVSEGPIYSFNVISVTNIYYCVATNDLGQQESSKIHLGNDDLINGSLQWEAVLGGICGIILLVCLVVCVWLLVSRRRLQRADSTQQQNQHQTGEELIVVQPARKTEDEEEEIHYGEISFSKQTPEPSSASVQDSGQQEDTLYTQVKVSKATNSSAHAANSSDDVYAQVKKH